MSTNSPWRQHEIAAVTNVNGRNGQVPSLRHSFTVPPSHEYKYFFVSSSSLLFSFFPLPLPTPLLFAFPSHLLPTPPPLLCFASLPVPLFLFPFTSCLAWPSFGINSALPSLGQVFSSASPSKYLPHSISSLPTIIRLQHGFSTPSNPSR